MGLGQASVQPSEALQKKKKKFLYGPSCESKARFHLVEQRKAEPKHWLQQFLCEKSGDLAESG